MHQKLKAEAVMAEPPITAAAPSHHSIGESMTPMNVLPLASSEEIPIQDLSALLHDCYEVDESVIIKHSPYERTPQQDRIKEVVKEFNKEIEEKERVIDKAAMREGTFVEPGYYFLAHRNTIAEIAIGTGARLLLKIPVGYTDIKTIGDAHGPVAAGCHNMNDPIVGKYGKYIINVPLGQLARVWSGNTPLLLNEGYHVILDNLFREEKPMLINRSDQVIEHGIVHIIRVPQGSLGKVLINSKPYLLPYRKLPYSFNTPFFKFHGFVLESDPHISFNSIHLLQVPAGSVAKAWVGSKPLLLEYREQPYFFDNPLFRLEKQANGSEFMSGRVKHIQHGSINRLRPGINGEVEMAMIQHDERLFLVDRFVTVNDPSQAVIGFVNLSIQTYIFPSADTREQRKRDNPKATLDEINFEPMTTRDSLKIGLKLLVAYQIDDPPKLLTKLRMTDIVRHVESLAVSDMARAVQNSTSQNFLSSSVKSHDELEEHEMTVMDRVRVELGKHLADCGLKLVRFNIEESKVLDPELAQEMAKQALVAAKASAQQSVIEQNMSIARSNAEIDAMARRVQQDQNNEITISAAKAKLEADRITAEATVIHAEADRQVSEMRGEILRRYPGTLKLEMAKAQLSAMHGMPILLCPENLANTRYFNIQGLMGQLQKDR